MKRDELANRIWRTVVFSGAMLATPLATADTKQPPKADIKPKPDTVESLTSALAENEKKVNAAVDAVAAAQTEADRDLAKAKLLTAQRERAGLQTRLAALKKPAPATNIAKLEKQLKDADAKVQVAIEAVIRAQSDADRSAAKVKLDVARRERGVAAQKLKEEQAKSAKRPRTTDEDRPVGRGFILS